MAMIAQSIIGQNCSHKRNMWIKIFLAFSIFLMAITWPQMGAKIIDFSFT
jgi:hypothetical protein